MSARSSLSSVCSSSIDVDLQKEQFDGVADDRCQVVRKLGFTFRVVDDFGFLLPGVVVEGEVVEEPNCERDEERDKHPGIADRVAKILAENRLYTAEVHARECSDPGGPAIPMKTSSSVPSWE